MTKVSFDCYMLLYVYIRLNICFDYVMLNICSYFFQTMVSWYDGDSDYELSKDFEDLPSEHESDISSDEHDDQGDDD